MAKTLLLDTALWDLTKDVYGNIAVASSPYSVAQDVASAIKLFLGELWYDTTKGVPYFERILGRAPATSYLKAQMVKAALTVPTVVSASCFINSYKDRIVSGQVQVTIETGPTFTTPQEPTLSTSSGGNTPTPPQRTFTISFTGGAGGMVVFVGAGGGAIQFTSGS